MPLKVPNYTYTGTCPQTLLHFCQVHIRNGLAQDPATVLPYGSPLRLYEVSVQRYISDIYIYMYMYHMRPQSLNLKPQRSGQKKKTAIAQNGFGRRFRADTKKALTNYGPLHPNAARRTGPEPPTRWSWGCFRRALGAVLGFVGFRVQGLGSSKPKPFRVLGFIGFGVSGLGLLVEGGWVLN